MEKKTYSVENTKSGHVFGLYVDTCEEGAIYQMLAEAGEAHRMAEGTVDDGVKAFEVGPAEEVA